MCQATARLVHGSVPVKAVTESVTVPPIGERPSRVILRRPNAMPIRRHARRTILNRHKNANRTPNNALQAPKTSLISAMRKVSGYATKNARRTSRSARMTNASPQIPVLRSSVRPASISASAEIRNLRACSSVLPTVRKARYVITALLVATN